MDVHGNAVRLVARDAQHEIGALRAAAAEACKGFEIARSVATKLHHRARGDVVDGLCFGLVKRAAMDELIDLANGKARHLRGSARGGEELPRGRKRDFFKRAD